jgi:hypothetical protein
MIEKLVQFEKKQVCERGATGGGRRCNDNDANRQ